MGKPSTLVEVHGRGQGAVRLKEQGRRLLLLEPVNPCLQQRSTRPFALRRLRHRHFSQLEDAIAIRFECTGTDNVAAAACEEDHAARIDNVLRRSKHTLVNGLHEKVFLEPLNIKITKIISQLSAVRHDLAGRRGIHAKNPAGLSSQRHAGKTSLAHLHDKLIARLKAQVAILDPFAADLHRPLL